MKIQSHDSVRGGKGSGQAIREVEHWWRQAWSTVMPEGKKRGGDMSNRWRLWGRQKGQVGRGAGHDSFVSGEGKSFRGHLSVIGQLIKIGVGRN